MFLTSLPHRQFDDNEIDEMIEKGDMQVFDDGFLKIGRGSQVTLPV